MLARSLLASLPGTRAVYSEMASLLESETRLKDIVSPRSFGLVPSMNGGNKKYGASGVQRRGDRVGAKRPGPVRVWPRPTRNRGDIGRGPVPVVGALHILRLLICGRGRGACSVTG